MNKTFNSSKLLINQRNLAKSYFLSINNYSKKIVIQKEETKTTIEGIAIESDRKDKLIDLKKIKSECCPICSLNLKVKYHDVLILSQYLDEDNKIIPFRLSNLCGNKYFLISQLIKLAQKCNLLPKPKDHIKFGVWEDLNHYVDFPNRKRDQPMKIVKPEFWK